MWHQLLGHMKYCFGTLGRWLSKHFPHRCEDLNSMSSTHVSSSAWWHVPAMALLGGGDRWVFRTCWLASFASPTHRVPGPSERRCLNRSRQMAPEKWHPRLTSGLHMPTYVPVYLYTHVYHTHINKSHIELLVSTVGFELCSQHPPP